MCAVPPAANVHRVYDNHVVNSRRHREGAVTIVVIGSLLE